MAELDYCEMCYRETTDLVSDHNHQSQLRRGRICRGCNARLGHLEVFLKNPGVVLRIRGYLEEFDLDGLRDLTTFFEQNIVKPTVPCFLREIPSWHQPV